ncbi:MAG: hypothetical protein ABIY50_12280 [Ignavibacteria bacterium]
MKKTISFLMVMFFLVLSINTYAQVNTYTFSQSSNPYSEITGTLFDSATSAGGATSLDDNVYLSRAIGFSFTFNGNSYSTYNMNTNGQITFGATSPGTTNYSAISSTIAYDGAIAGLSRDLQGIYGFTATRTLSSTTLTGVTAFAGIVVGKIVVGTGIAAGTRVTAINTGAGTVDISIAATAAGTSTLNCASGELRSETQGAAGSRVHIIQFKNFKRFGSATLLDNFNFQIRIYETTNKIDVIYGSFTVNATATTAQVGLRGATNADFNNRTTTTDWSATTAGAVNNASMTLSATVFPASGLKYTWTPDVVFANDVATIAITNPLNGAYEGIYAPQATIKNVGTNNQLTPFNITCTISPGGYTNTVSDTLSALQSRSKSFANFNFSAGVPYTITVYTSLASDQDRSNDTQRVVVTLINGNANYGNDTGYFFANNLATTQPSFPVKCLKDTLGSRSLVVNGVTQPGNTLVGTLDDGYYIKSLKAILLELNLDTTNRHIKFNGVCYDSIFPGTNGIVGLTQQFGATSLSAFAIDGQLVADNALLPLWHDFNLSTLGGGTNRLSYSVKGNQLIITYDRATSFAPTTDYATFQVVIELVTGCAGSNSNFRYTYADTTGGQTSTSFVNNYLAGYNAAPGAITTFRNYVVGYSLLGPPKAYAAYVSPANPFPAASPTPLYVYRTIYNPTTKQGLAVEFGSNVNLLNVHDCVSLTVRLTLEGLQSNLSPRARDTVTVEIRDGSAPPYNILQKSRVFLDSTVNQKGIKTIALSILKRNSPYYIVINHRNSIRSWSNAVTPTGSSLTYDFTGSVAQTFGSNAVVVNGNASFYSGDVNQDGIVDGSDAALIDNDASNFVTGDYVITDLNWDGIVDGSDAAIVDNNATNFVSEVKPVGALAPFMESFTKYNYTPSTEIIIIADPYAQPKTEVK